MYIILSLMVLWILEAKHFSAVFSTVITHHIAYLKYFNGCKSSLKNMKSIFYIYTTVQTFGVSQKCPYFP